MEEGADSEPPFEDRESLNQEGSLPFLSLDDNIVISTRGTLTTLASGGSGLDGLQWSPCRGSISPRMGALDSSTEQDAPLHTPQKRPRLRRCYSSTPYCSSYSPDHSFNDAQPDTTFNQSNTGITPGFATKMRLHTQGMEHMPFRSFSQPASPVVPWATKLFEDKTGASCNLGNQRESVCFEDKGVEDPCGVVGDSGIAVSNTSSIDDQNTDEENSLKYEIEDAIKMISHDECSKSVPLEIFDDPFLETTDTSYGPLETQGILHSNRRKSKISRSLSFNPIVSDETESGTKRSKDDDHVVIRKAKILSTCTSSVHVAAGAAASRPFPQSDSENVAPKGGPGAYEVADIPHFEQPPVPPVTSKVVSLDAPPEAPSVASSVTPPVAPAIIPLNVSSVTPPIVPTVIPPFASSPTPPVAPAAIPPVPSQVTGPIVPSVAPLHQRPVDHLIQPSPQIPVASPVVPAPQPGPFSGPFRVLSVPGVGNLSPAPLVYLNTLPLASAQATLATPSYGLPATASQLSAPNYTNYTNPTLYMRQTPVPCNAPNQGFPCLGLSGQGLMSSTPVQQFSTGQQLTAPSHYTLPPILPTALQTSSDGSKGTGCDTSYSTPGQAQSPSTTHIRPHDPAEQLPVPNYYPSVNRRQEMKEKDPFPVTPTGSQAGCGPVVHTQPEQPQLSLRPFLITPEDSYTPQPNSVDCAVQTPARQVGSFAHDLSSSRDSDGYDLPAVHSDSDESYARPQTGTVTGSSLHTMPNPGCPPSQFGVPLGSSSDYQNYEHGGRGPQMLHQCLPPQKPYPDARSYMTNAPPARQQQGQTPPVQGPPNAYVIPSGQTGGSVPVLMGSFHSTPSSQSQSIPATFLSYPYHQRQSVVHQTSGGYPTPYHVTSANMLGQGGTVRPPVTFIRLPISTPDNSSMMFQQRTPSTISVNISANRMLSRPNTAETEVQNLKSRLFDIFSLQIGTCKISWPDHNNQRPLKSQVKLLFAQRKLQYEFEMQDEYSGGADGAAQPHFLTIVAGACLKNIVGLAGSDAHVVLEMGAEPEVTVQQSSVDEMGNIVVSAPRNKSAYKVLPVIEHQFRTSPYHWITLTRPMADQFKWHLSVYDQYFSLLQLKQLVVNPAKTLGPTIITMPLAPEDLALEDKDEKPHNKYWMGRCSCMRGCQNTRCSCVHNLRACTRRCACVTKYQCSNPLNQLAQLGIEPQDVLADGCLVFNMSRVRVFREYLAEEVALPCCGVVVPKLHLIPGKVPCPEHNCPKIYSYSWCVADLCDEETNPRNHCPDCNRCQSSGAVHCMHCHKCFVPTKRKPRCTCSGQNSQAHSSSKSVSTHAGARSPEPRSARPVPGDRSGGNHEQGSASDPSATVSSVSKVPCTTEQGSAYLPAVNPRNLPQAWKSGARVITLAASGIASMATLPALDGDSKPGKPQVPYSGDVKDTDRLHAKHSHLVRGQSNNSPEHQLRSEPTNTVSSGVAETAAPATLKFEPISPSPAQMAGVGRQVKLMSPDLVAKQRNQPAFSYTQITEHGMKKVIKCEMADRTNVLPLSEVPDNITRGDTLHIEITKIEPDSKDTQCREASSVAHFITPMVRRSRANTNKCKENVPLYGKNLKPARGRLPRIKDAMKLVDSKCGRFTLSSESLHSQRIIVDSELQGGQGPLCHFQNGDGAHTLSIRGSQVRYLPEQPEQSSEAQAQPPDEEKPGPVQYDSAQPEPYENDMAMGSSEQPLIIDLDPTSKRPVKEVKVLATNKEHTRTGCEESQDSPIRKSQKSYSRRGEQDGHLKASSRRSPIITRSHRRLPATNLCKGHLDLEASKTQTGLKVDAAQGVNTAGCSATVERNTVVGPGTSLQAVYTGTDRGIHITDVTTTNTATVATSDTETIVTIAKQQEAGVTKEPEEANETTADPRAQTKPGDTSQSDSQTDEQCVMGRQHDLELTSSVQESEVIEISDEDQSESQLATSQHRTWSDTRLHVDEDSSLGPDPIVTGPNPNEVIHWR